MEFDDERREWFEQTLALKNAQGEIENTTVSYREGDSTDFRVHPSRSYQRGCSYHPVQVFEYIRPLSFFAHLSDETICGLFDPAQPWGFMRNNGHEKTFWEVMPRYDPVWCMQDLTRKYGLFCKRCEKVERPDAGDLGIIHFSRGKSGFAPCSWKLEHWKIRGICSNCCVEIRAEGWRVIQEERNAVAFRRRMNETREQRSTAAKERAEARRKRRLVERAAYDFLAETGLLTHLETTL